MKTREQAYAEDAFQRVSNVGKDKADRYGAMAHQLPILIRQAGLVQALSFIESRKNDGMTQLLDDVAKTIGQSNASQLVKTSREANVSQYMRLTQQTMAALLWYKRFAQSILEIDQTKAATEGGD